MIRKLFRWIFGFVLRVFFRHIEMAGTERVPKEGPVLFVLNHPNALIDPAFMLCLAPRPVSFLAKSTLFKIPVVGTITRGFDSLPVYRKQDGGGDNRETFRLARELLGRGGTIALFPEGTSHSDPMMRPMKTGAARIALGAELDGLMIMPAGLYYDAKGTFRSSALVYYGEPFEVTRVPMDEEGQPPRDAVNALTDKIEAVLGEVTLQAEQQEALRIVERAEQIFSAADEDEESLSESFELRRRFIEGHHQLRLTHPEELDAAERRLLRYERDLKSLGLDPDHPAPEQFTLGNSLSYAVKSLMALLTLLPLATVGVVIHLPAYHLTRHISGRLYKGEDDMVGTIKILSSLLFYPLTWGLCAGVAGWFGGWIAALITIVVAPVMALAALHFLERFESALGAARGLLLFMTRRRLFERLHDERLAIRDEILRLAALAGLDEQDPA